MNNIRKLKLDSIVDEGICIYPEIKGGERYKLPALIKIMNLIDKVIALKNKIFS